MIEKDIESLHSDHSVTSAREVNNFRSRLTTEFLRVRLFSAFAKTVVFFSWLQRWFKKLPPVLTFELSRFEFNTQLGRPEKIHKKLEFPQIVYMDRWANTIIDVCVHSVSLVPKWKKKLLLLSSRHQDHFKGHTATTFFTRIVSETYVFRMQCTINVERKNIWNVSTNLTQVLISLGDTVVCLCTDIFTKT